MSGDSQPESLVGVFMAEATEGLDRLWGVLHPSDGSVPTSATVQPEFIIAHRLRGAASLYGFTGIAGLAEALEAALERTGAWPAGQWPHVVDLMRDLVALLRGQIQRIGRTGGEDAAACQEWQSRHAAELAPPAGAEAAAPPVSSPVPALADDYLLPELDAEVFSYFAPEAQEYLDTIETALLRLDKDPKNADTIQLLFRTAHTLKGSAFTVGFTAIGDLTHHVEDLMGAIRDGRMTVTPGMADVIFRSVDVVRLLLKRDSRQLAHLRSEYAAIKQRLQRLAEGSAETVEPVAAAPSSPTAVVLPAEQPAEAPRVEAAAAEQPEAAPKPAPKDVEEGTVIRVSRDRLERLLNLVGELVIGRGRLEQRLLVLEQLSNQVLSYKNRLFDAVRTFEEKHAFTLPTASGPSEPGLPALPAISDFGALEFDKYDDFNILARRVAEISADVGEAMGQLNGSIRKAREDMGHLQRLTLGMRDEIAHARMVPIGQPFTRYRRAVREMAKATGKEANLITSGEQTEVDTVLVERLVDPLVHLVRNAVYHGIEKTEVRLAQGKPATGSIYLHAAHRGNSVVIEVEDDGAGIDVDKIKGKAMSQGLIRPEQAAHLSESEAMKLIFLPGFSTADAVGDQAGRGVGMDVVKRAIEGMNGHIDIETVKGIGTKFTLTLPLTLLISTALLVRVGKARYAVPLPSIREVVLPDKDAIQEISGRAILQIGEEAVEVRSFAALLGQDSLPTDGQPQPVVIVRTATGAVGLTVDELLGRQEIVIKTLGTLRPFRESCFVGATIDPEGHVLLVVDVSRMVGGRAAEALPAAETAVSALLEEGGEDDRLPASLPQPAASGILLIDDSLSVRKFVGRMLEGGGYEVDTAVDGEDGLRKASARAYQLIITDLEMPKLNGYEVIQALRARTPTKHTPILVMTTRAGDKHRQMALSMGATGYITKPVEERGLIQEVEQRIGATGARA